MTVTSSSDSHAAITATLRAAGCVFAEEEASLLMSEAKTATELTDMVARRVSGEPIEYVVGWAEFWDLRIAVDPSVFVPRRRSEFLVREAARLTKSGSVVVDLCCGSGALGLALNAAVADIELHAADIEPAAAHCAYHNLTPLGGHVYKGDLFDALPSRLKGRIDILLANTPYVPTEAIKLLPAEARLHEPLITLDGGTDGLDVQRRVAQEAPDWLAPGGHLLVETSERQAPEAAAIFAAAGLKSRIARDDELEATIVIASR